LTWKPFYEAAGITLQTALKWEAGKRPLRRPYYCDEFCWAWWKAFGIPHDWLSAGITHDRRSSVSSNSPAVESDETQAAA
jgi:hypothetical protein